jgi:hypothetical protein
MMATTILNTPLRYMPMASTALPAKQANPFQLKQRSGSEGATSPTTIDDVLAENQALRETLSQQQQATPLRNASVQDSFVQRRKPTIYEQSLQQRIEQPWWKRALIFGGAAATTILATSLIASGVSKIPAVNKLANHPSSWVSGPSNFVGMVAKYTALDAIWPVVAVGLNNLFD